MGQLQSSIRLLITSGVGPFECRQAVALALSSIEREAHDLALEFLSEVPDIRRGDFPSSATVSLKGIHAAEFASRWCGTVQWTCKSLSRPGHKRQNWFIGIFRLDVSASKVEQLRPEDLQYQSFRAGGPGGQHQNKTDSAVRLVHAPSGLTVVAKDERSQFRNKKLAYDRLLEKLVLKQALAIEANRKDENQLHRQLERGNPIRCFVGAEFIEK